MSWILEKLGAVLWLVIAGTILLPFILLAISIIREKRGKPRE